jgi:hypothetical protein
MSTTGLHGARTAQRPPSQLACTLAPVGNSHPRQRNRANVSLQDKVTRSPAALTNGTVHRNAKCCAGLCKASSPARRAPCQSPRAISRARESPPTSPLLRIIIKNDQRQIDSMSNDPAVAVIEPDGRTFGESVREEGEVIVLLQEWLVTAAVDEAIAFAG